MCCHSEQRHGHSDRCGHYANHYTCGTGTRFLSKKKRVELLKEHLDRLREEVQDMEDYISEIEAEK